MLFVVTTPQIIDTGKCSWLFTTKVPLDQRRKTLGLPFGTLTQRPYGDNEISPFSLMQGGPAQSDTHRWDLHLFNSKGWLATAGCDVKDSGVKTLLHPEGEEPLEAILLLERAHFEEVETACRDLGIDLDQYHHDTPLATS